TALNGTSHVKTIRSKSVLGLSSVVMVFEPGTDMTGARQMVAERLAAEAARQSWPRPPVVLPPLSSMSRVMKIGLSSKTLSQQDLTVLTTWTVRPKLMSIPGVANVAVWGQRDRQVQVRVDPDRLRTRGVTLDQVQRAAADAVSAESGGWVETPTTRLPVRHLPAVRTPADLADAVIPGTPHRLGDVADVGYGSPPPIGDAVINDGPGLLLIVEKQPWGNTLEVTRNVEAALAQLRPGLKDVEVDSTIFRPATYIERALGNLTHALVVGCVLVVVILVVFLFDWRTAVISMTAIPLSLIAASLVLYWRGGTINTMVLAGLVIALGEVVDDAIIDVENIVRRLRLNALAGFPESRFTVVLKASLEVRSAVVYASLIVVLVFLPVFFMEGVAGSFFRPLALSYVLAIMASLAVALTVTPAMSLLLVRGSAREHEAPVARALKRLYRRLLPPLVARPQWAFGVIIVAFALTGLAATRLGEEFLPDFKETDFLMHWVTKPGSSLEESTRITTLASQELRAIPGVRNFGSHIGRAEVADEVVGPNFTELWISIDETADHAATVAKIQAAVDGYPGLHRDLLTYLKERIKEVLTGASGSIVVRIYGADLATLRTKAKEVEAAMAGVPGTTNVKAESQVLVPQIGVRLRPDAGRLYGVTDAQVRRQVSTLLRGQRVGDVYEDQKRFAVVVTGVDALRTDLAALQRVPIDTPLGPVPLADVADVGMVSAPNEIKREGASRRIDVTCNATGRDLGTVAREVEAAVNQKVGFPREYHPEFLGEYAARAAAGSRLLWLAAAALVGIVVLLYVDFQSARLTFLVLLTLPFALVGGVFAALMSGGVLSLGSLVGFVTVLGIAARNGIMLVSHYRHLGEVEGEPFGVGLVLRGAEERLAPILMTALATGLALVPLVVGGEKPGQEIEYPLAVVILGGLVTSTLLNLFLLPPLYAVFGAGPADDRPAPGGTTARGAIPAVAGSPG
ncbi:MAG TPA: efflux RND transporter permease subunit, partial [Tepidisphaeraceae bacterium]|nr:efflux RND transporter permease subunit [Tepidisphaeraceae bacterium]